MPASSIRNAASRCAVRRVAVPAARSCSLPSSAAGRAPTSCRGLASTSRRNAITNFDMPAMSPTMTEGGIATWKVKEGQPFGAGDVLLEIETDKATMDVEAQEDGVLGKIIVPNGTKDVKVGRTIALLAEEGDDISNLEAPAEEPSESPKSSAPKQDSEKSSEAGVSLQQSDLKDQEKASTASSKNLGAGSPHPASSNSHASESHAPMFPSVSRLLAENDIKDSSVIKGTGVRGMITKGDVLAYLGKTSNPNGSFKPFTGGVSTLGPAAGSKGSGAGDKKVDTKPLTGEQFRSLIMGGLADASASARAKKAATASASSTTQEQSSSLSTKKGSTNAGFDQLLASYSFTGSAKPSSAGGKKDPLAGLL